MKKLNMAIFAVLLITLAACTKKEPTTETPSAETQATETIPGDEMEQKEEKKADAAPAETPASH